VPLFGKRPYDRADSLSRASKALGRGRRKAAIAEYRRVLVQEPNNAVILAKLAALLAETRQLPEAREKFNAAGERYEKQGFPEKALAVYVQAAAYLPRQIDLWETIAG
jgi:tetratricopeptide (TPR) repeat protein